MKLTENQKEDLLRYLLYKKYLSEFRVIDGLSQHPEGMGFDEWLVKILEMA